MTLETLVAQFHQQSLPREAWTHRAHLGVALWTMQHFPFDQALERLRREIKAYNESVGVVNGPFSGYHETLTHFYLRAVATFSAQLSAEKSGNKTDLDDLWMQLAEKWGDKNAIFAYYSRRHLFSPSSRARFAAPDLRPLDF